MSDRDAPFYVGFLRAPPAYRRAIFGLTLVIAALVAIDAFVFAQIQQQPMGGAWSDEIVTLTGTLDVDPYPVLRTTGTAGELKTILLVAEGKVGAEAILGGLTEGLVQLNGTMIERDGRAMLEIVTPPVRGDALSASSFALMVDRPPAEDLGVVSLKGEIVDPKCWFGVMRPSDGPVHKACATLCLTGGIPPVLVTRNAEGKTMAYLLVDPDNQPVGEALLDVVAEPVAVEGRLERRGDLYVLRIDPATVHRL